MADYVMHGARVFSDVELPGVRRSGPVDPAGVPLSIRRGRVADVLPGGRAVGRCQLSGDAAVVTVPGVARYRIEQGLRITLEADPQAADADVRSHLLGVALGVTWHQRGRLPLHASAVEVDGRAVVFAGPAGVGKSTLAALLADRGYPVVTDDACVVDFDTDGSPHTWTGVPQLKLASSSPAVIDGAVNGVTLAAAAGKRLWPVALAAAEPLPVGRIYVATDAGHPEACEPRRLSGSKAFEAVWASMHGRDLVFPMAAAAHYVAALTMLLGRISTFSLSPHADFGNADVWVDSIERQMCA